MARILALVAILSLTLTGCLNKDESGVEFSPTSDSADLIPTGTINATNAVPLPKEELKFYTINMDSLVDPSTENTIIVCTPDLEICKSICVSVYFPEVERWSLFDTDWLPNGKCVTYALQYPNGEDVPELLYYEGTYNNGECDIDAANPDFEGKGYFATVTVPEGQATPSPQGKRQYEVHTLLDSQDNFFSSIYLYNFRPPSSWDYMDPSLSAGYITPTLISGFSCIRKDQIQ